MGHQNESAVIKNMLREERSFPPPEQYRQHSFCSSPEAYEALWESARKNPESFWAEQAKELLSWFRLWDKTFDRDDEDHFRWFDGGKINASFNCLDRHLPLRADKIAIRWEGEPGDQRQLSYQELHHMVSLLADGLLRLGLRPGDVVTIYMPMIPEITASLLACARIGVMHNVVFAGFSPEALANRINDSGSTVLLTADGFYRKGQIFELKPIVDEALQQCKHVKKVLLSQRTKQEIPWTQGRDQWWNDFLAECRPAEAIPLDSEQPLFLLYTSGSTGKPKGVVHSTGGYLTGAATTCKYIFDLQDDDIFWCTADTGWITGHTYGTYGPLALGATVLMYEGAPQTPDWGRFWKIIQNHRVTKFYTAPTAIRSLIRYGANEPSRYDLSSLRLLGTVGEPINPEAWIWFHRVIGQGRCPVVDTWWQTETGSIMISAFPGAIPTKPGSAARPFPGIIAAIVDEQGRAQSENQGGYLVIEKPWPSMMRTIYGDHERFRRDYCSRVAGSYFTGDGARYDEEGYFWIMGRIDDVLNVSGHRLSTMEIESALVSHPLVTEAAVVGRPDDIRGEVIICFVTLIRDADQGSATTQALKDHVVRHIGALARPEEICFTEALPKTRSGKIMRRLLRDIAAGRKISGDVSTLDQNIPDLSGLLTKENEEPPSE